MSRILMSDGTILLKELIFAETRRARMKGLLGRTSLDSHYGMLIRPCKSIHMWFMQFPIDAAFLDHEMNVLKITRNLKPWQIGIAPTKTYCVLETAAGVMSAIQESDQLIIQ